MFSSIGQLFDTEGFPPRWQCGSGWTDALGWTHIVSDLLIWASYTAIPIVLAIFVLRRKDAPFPKVFWLFVAFIFFCGAVHLVEAIIFWEPVYRLSAVIKVGTAAVSVATVCALVPTIPRALSLRSAEELEHEVDQRTKSLQESEAHQRVLMSELDHRVKNNISAIMSLADQTIASTHDIDRFREAFMGRLMALTRTHEALARSKWAGARLRQVIDLTLDPYHREGDECVTTDGPAVQLDSKSASSLSMALHELATNSVKYGALSVPGGTVSLTWTADVDGLRLTWLERGGPPVTAPATPGFGTTLVNGMIGFELQGEVKFNYARDGLECTLAIPSTRVTVVSESKLRRSERGDG